MTASDIQRNDCRPTPLGQMLEPRALDIERVNAGKVKNG